MKKVEQKRERFAFFPKGMSTIMVAVLYKNRFGKIEALSKFRLAKSEVDISKRFPLRNGEPVIGSRVYRERTKKEIAAANLQDAPYELTLVPLCNTGEPWIKVENEKKEESNERVPVA